MEGDNDPPARGLCCVGGADLTTSETVMMCQLMRGGCDAIRWKAAAGCVGPRAQLRLLLSHPSRAGLQRGPTVAQRRTVRWRWEVLPDWCDRPVARPRHCAALPSANC